MTNKLRQYFPMIHTRQEVLAEIEAKPKLKQEFYSKNKVYFTFALNSHNTWKVFIVVLDKIIYYNSKSTIKIHFL